MATLIGRYGGVAILAPSMRELPLDQNTAALEFMRDLKAGKIDVVIFLTGVGTRTLIEAVSSVYPKEELTESLRRATLVQSSSARLSLGNSTGALRRCGTVVTTLGFVGT